jgi:hypothetical protein
MKKETELIKQQSKHESLTFLLLHTDELGKINYLNNLIHNNNEISPTT